MQVFWDIELLIGLIFLDASKECIAFILNGRGSRRTINPEDLSPKTLGYFRLAAI